MAATLALRTTLHGRLRRLHALSALLGIELLRIPLRPSQRVVLYEEGLSDPKGKQYNGSVIWRTKPIKARGILLVD